MLLKASISWFAEGKPLRQIGCYKNCDGQRGDAIGEILGVDLVQSVGGAMVIPEILLTVVGESGARHPLGHQRSDIGSAARSSDFHFSH